MRSLLTRNRRTTFMKINYLLPQLFTSFLKLRREYCLSILFILLITLSLHAQYQLQPAFQNLPPFSYPLELVHTDDGSNRLFVAQLKGIVYVFNNSPSVSTRKAFIDLSSKVTQGSFEAGLLGITFHPDFVNNRYFFVHYIFDTVGIPSGQCIRISRFTAGITNPDTAFINSEKILLTIPLPARNHNGGKVAFGPDNYLYISIGDGYFFDGIRAQDKTELLGKILRINVDSSSGGRNYSIPVTNPFFGNSQGWREEIYAYGFRNPWRFSFDLTTNKLWLGDVGQFRYEEVDTISNGGNYGWNKLEGFHCYPDTNSCDTSGRNFIPPVWEYQHNTIPPLLSYAVVGGFVYRGSSMPGLYGKYVYGDYSQGIIYALTYEDVSPPRNQLLIDTNFAISSFGEDQNKELYILKISPTDGRIYKLYSSNLITLDLKVIVEGFYNLSTNALNIRDTVTVYLHSVTAPFPVVDSARTVIDSLSFNGLCQFNSAPDGSYYISVKHRNSLETWSEPGGESLTREIPASYDFTSQTNKTYGNNTILKGTKYCIISGDCNQNGVINAVDRATVIAELGADGYLNGDLDGNGIVNALDRAIVVSNLGRSKMTP